MKIIVRLSALLVVLASVACGGGSSGGSGGAAAVAGVSPIDGNYEGLGTFTTNIRVVDLNANTPPVVDDCVGDISIVVDENAADVLTGSGLCSLQNNANVATYSLVGGFLNDVDFEGQITISFSGRDSVLNFAGSRSGDVLDATFAGRTLQTARLAIDWDGRFSATRP